MISILLPFHNEAEFIADCIQSIRNQSETNWELLAVDDFSTDNSFQIMEDFVSKDSRIQLIRNTEKGIIPALKIAFDQSKGDFITRMDADDLMPERKLEHLKSKLTIAGTHHIATGTVKYFSRQKLQEGFIKYAQWLNTLSSGNRHFDSIYKECVIASPAWMAFKSDLQNINAFSDSRYPEDYDLVFKWHENKFTIVSVNELVHLWRDHPSRASRNDPNYQDQGFSHLKVPYFLKIDRDDSKELILWGAGKKAKAIAQSLIKEKAPFRWMSNNQNKIGKQVYGVLVENSEVIAKVKAKQVILAISSVDFQAQKEKELNRLYIQASELFEFV